jgi:GNAT superfamily N-acetyltransferase
MRDLLNGREGAVHELLLVGMNEFCGGIGQTARAREALAIIRPLGPVACEVMSGEADTASRAARTVVLATKKGNRVVATMTFCVHRPRLGFGSVVEVDALAVTEAERGSGFGKVLVACIKSIAEALNQGGGGMPAIVVLVAASSATPFYQHQGFLTSGARASSMRSRYVSEASCAADAAAIDAGAAVFCYPKMAAHPAFAYWSSQFLVPTVAARSGS